MSRRLLFSSIRSLTKVFIVFNGNQKPLCTKRFSEKKNDMREGRDRFLGKFPIHMNGVMVKVLSPFDRL